MRYPPRVLCNTALSDRTPREWSALVDELTGHRLALVLEDEAIQNDPRWLVMGPHSKAVQKAIFALWDRAELLIEHREWHIVGALGGAEEQESLSGIRESAGGGVELP